MSFFSVSDCTQLLQKSLKNEFQQTVRKRPTQVSTQLFRLSKKTSRSFSVLKTMAKGHRSQFCQYESLVCRSIVWVRGATEVFGSTCDNQCNSQTKSSVSSCDGSAQQSFSSPKTESPPSSILRNSARNQELQLGFMCVVGEHINWWTKEIVLQPEKPENDPRISRETLPIRCVNVFAVILTWISAIGRMRPGVADVVMPLSWAMAAFLKPYNFFCFMMWSTQIFQALGVHGSAVGINIPSMVCFSETRDLLLE